MAIFTFEWPVGERTAIRQTLVEHNLVLRDLRPIWKRFIPYIRRRHKRTFESQTSPFGQAWPPLSEPYATRKRALYGSKPILVATGTLMKAASRKGAAGQIFTMEPQAMTFGVALGKVYPAVHQRTERARKDGTPIKRIWLGLNTEQDINIGLRAEIAGYLRERIGKVSAVGRGRA